MDKLLGFKSSTDTSSYSKNDAKPKITSANLDTSGLRLQPDNNSLYNIDNGPDGYDSTLQLSIKDHMRKLEVRK
jgi:hypothetical protein